MHQVDALSKYDAFMCSGQCNGWDLVANPWSVYGIYEEDGSFFYHNKLTKIIQVLESSWEDLPNIGGKGSDGHLLGVFYRGCEVIVDTFRDLEISKSHIENCMKNQ